MEENLSIEDILFNDFKDQANEDFLKIKIQFLIQDQVIHDCTFFINWNRTCYRDNLKHNLQNILNYPLNHILALTNNHKKFHNIFLFHLHQILACPNNL